MKIRTNVPKRYIDVLDRKEDIDINLYDDGELVEGYKFNAEYFRERIANVLIVEHTEDFAIAYHPVRKCYELHNLTDRRQVYVSGVESGYARAAQEVLDMFNHTDDPDAPAEDVVEEIFNETGFDKFFISEVLYGG